LHKEVIDMPLYTYEALDSHGTAVKNNVEAFTQAEAVSKIRNLGYYPVNITEESHGRETIARTDSKSRHKRIDVKVKTKVITEFARELATLQEAGLPILGSLRSLEEQEKNNNFRKVIGAVANDIEGGDTLSDAMAKHPRCFDRLFIGMVTAGEKGGILEMILTRVADFMEKAERLRNRARNAMVYPTAVLATAFTIVILLMTFVIPRFQIVLSEMTDKKMNPLTGAVMGISVWVARDYGWAILLGIPFGLLFLYRIIRRFEAGRLAIDSIILKLPVLGELSTSICVARWTMTLGTLLGAGVPILDAIAVTSQTTGNERFSRLLMKVADSIRQGDSFSNPLRHSKLMPGSVVKMISVGEESGDLDKMLIKVAEKYDYRVDSKVNSLVSLLEPVVIILLGIVVLFIVLAILLPILDILNTSTGV
jgi:type IV pilus assembly protein PilC